HASPPGRGVRSPGEHQIDSPNRMAGPDRPDGGDEVATVGHLDAWRQRQPDPGSRPERPEVHADPTPAVGVLLVLWFDRRDHDTPGEGDAAVRPAVRVRR